jgi:hypothetical protein
LAFSLKGSEPVGISSALGVIKLECHGSSRRDVASLEHDGKGSIAAGRGNGRELIKTSVDGTCGRYGCNKVRPHVQLGVRAEAPTKESDSPLRIALKGLENFIWKLAGEQAQNVSIGIVVIRESAHHVRRRIL